MNQCFQPVCTFLHCGCWSPTLTQWFTMQHSLIYVFNIFIDRLSLTSFTLHLLQTFSALLSFFLFLTLYCLTDLSCRYQYEELCWSAPLLLRRLSIKKSIPSTCSSPALFETDEPGSTHKSARLRYLQPTWGEDLWRLDIGEHLLGVCREGSLRWGVGTQGREGCGWQKDKKKKKRPGEDVEQRSRIHTHKSLRCNESQMRYKVPRSTAAGDGWGEGLQKGRKAAPACYTGPWIQPGCHLQVTWDQALTSQLHNKISCKFVNNMLKSHSICSICCDRPEVNTTCTAPRVKKITQLN